MNGIEVTTEWFDGEEWQPVDDAPPTVITEADSQERLKHMRESYGCRTTSDYYDPVTVIRYYSNAIGENIRETHRPYVADAQT